MPHLSRHLAATALIMLTTLLALPKIAHAEERVQKSLYKVSWHDASVARVSLHIGCPTAKHTPAALIASSTGLAHDIHSFSIRLDSFLSLTRDILPLQGRTSITEEARTRAYISSFSDSSVSVKSDIFGKKKEASHDLPQPSHDLLSWVLATGKEISDPDFSSSRYTVWDGWKLVELKIVRQPSSDISTPFKTFKDAHVLAVTRTRVDSSGKALGESSSLGTVWFSKTTSPRLVAMDFESRMGLATIRLVKHSTKTCKV